MRVTLDVRTSSATLGLIRPLTLADCDIRTLLFLPDVHLFVPDVIGILLYVTSTSLWRLYPAL